MNQKVKAIQALHFAICGGMIVAYVMVGQISINKLMINSIELSDITFIALPFLAFFLGNFLFRMQLRQSDPKLKPEDKMAIYQTASLIRWAILEGAAFIILFIKPSLIIFGLLLILYIIYLRPTEDRINADFQSVS